MKAIVQERYGPLADVLRVEDIDEPALDDEGVLLRVHAASIHVGDTFGMRGVPYVFRAMYGLRRPKVRVPGTDAAGIVEAVGAAVTGFRPGDEVFGWGTGAFAERMRTSQEQLLIKPAELPFGQASALGVSALTAYQALRDMGEVQPGHKVLVNGASGGVGTYAVQIAKWLGAEVTAVCSTRNVELVRSIGADHVVDYTADDFTQGQRRYDFILDNVGNHSFSDTRSVLEADGKLLSNGGAVGGWIEPVGHFAKAALSSMLVRQQLRPFDLSPTKEDLATLADLVVAGKIRPVIERSYPLDEAVAAIAHVAEGHGVGTTVIIA